MKKIAIESDGANQTTVSVGDLDLYFSYQTVVAFRTPSTGLVVSENIWSNTTGKHLTAIDSGCKSGRVKHTDFLIALDKMLAGYGLGV